MIEAVVELEARVLVAALAILDVSREATIAPNWMPQLEITVANGDEVILLSAFQITHAVDELGGQEVVEEFLDKDIVSGAKIRGHGTTHTRRRRHRTTQVENALKARASLAVKYPTEARDCSRGIYCKLHSSASILCEQGASFHKGQLLGSQLYRNRLLEERLVTILHCDKVVRENGTSQRNEDKN